MREKSISVDSISRRKSIELASSLGVFALIDQWISGCASRTFGKNQSMGELKQEFDTDEMVKSLLFNNKNFVTTWNEIGSNPNTFPKVEVYMEFLGRVSVPMPVGKPDRVALLRILLILFRVRANPVNLFNELLSERIDLVFAGGKSPVIVVNHENVTKVVLNPSSIDSTNPTKLKFQLAGYRPEMPNLLGHFMLCDDDIKRHDLEKAFVHKIACRPTDGKKVWDICIREANRLIEKKIKEAGSFEQIDLVQDFARWIPVRVISEYFGLPCGIDKNGNEVQLSLHSEDELLLFSAYKTDIKGQIVGFDVPASGKISPVTQSNGNRRFVSVSDSLIYRWVANGFWNLFLNAGKDATIIFHGRRSGTHLLYYIYRTILAERRILDEQRESGSPDTFISRLVKAWKEKTEISKLDADVKKIAAEGFLGERPPAQLSDGSVNPLAALCTNIEAYRLAVQAVGAIAGAVVTVEESIARVFHVLLSKNAEFQRNAPSDPTPLERCISISKELKRTNADWATIYKALAPYYREALRFAPQAELLPRVLAPNNVVDFEVKKALVREGIVAAPDNQSLKVKVAESNLVLAGLYSAMHDPDVVTKPKEFNTSRPDNCYLEFGWSASTEEKTGKNAVSEQQGGSNIEAVANANSTTKAVVQGNSCLGKFIAPVEIVSAMYAIFSSCQTGLRLPQDSAGLEFQKSTPPDLSPNFKLEENKFVKEEGNMNAAPGPYPASLLVEIY